MVIVQPETVIRWPRRVSSANCYFPNRNNGLAVLYPARDKIAGMLEIIELLTHYLVTLIKLLKPGGVKKVRDTESTMT